MSEPKEIQPPVHIRFGFGLLHVGGVVVCNYEEGDMSKAELQRAVHAHAKSHGKKFTTAESFDGDDLLIKRTA